MNPPASSTAEGFGKNELIVKSTRPRPLLPSRRAQRGFVEFLGVFFALCFLLAWLAANVIAVNERSPSRRIDLISRQASGAESAIDHCALNGDCLSIAQSGARKIDASLLAPSSVACLDKLCPLPGEPARGAERPWRAYFSERADDSLVFYAEDSERHDYSVAVWTPRAEDGSVSWRRTPIEQGQRLPDLPLASRPAAPHSDAARAALVADHWRSAPALTFDEPHKTSFQRNAFCSPPPLA
jgi:hypothetical protein